MKRMLSSSRIFLGDNVVRRQRHKVANYLSSNRYGTFQEPGVAADICAFALRIGNAIVVEFSKVGNACYIYKEAEFDKKIFRMTSTTIKQLKDRSIATRLNHSDGWPSSRASLMKHSTETLESQGWRHNV